jgi:hypothetical protein
MSGSEGEIDERILDESAVGDEADSDEITVIPIETAIQPSAPNAPTVVQSPSAQGVGEVENKNSGDSFVDESEEDGTLTPYEATEQGRSHIDELNKNEAARLDKAVHDKMCLWLYEKDKREGEKGEEVPIIQMDDILYEVNDDSASRTVSGNTETGWELNAKCYKDIPGHENCREIRVVHVMPKEAMTSMKRAAKVQLIFLGDLILFRYAMRRYARDQTTSGKSEKMKQINEMSTMIEKKVDIIEYFVEKVYNQDGDSAFVMNDFGEAFMVWARHCDVARHWMLKSKKPVWFDCPLLEEGMANQTMFQYM